MNHPNVTQFKPIYSTETPEDVALVRKVGRLVDCLDSAGATAGFGLTAVHEEASQFALTAAGDAENLIRAQRERIAELELLALTDGLTGLLNRRAIEAEMGHALAAARRYDERGVLVYMDMDGFKAVNDAYGHAAGDEVLRQVARVLQENVRDSDRVGRLGGDEFAILLARTSWEDGIKRAEAIDRVVNTTVVNWNGCNLALSASFGVHKYGADDDDGELLNQADKAMYKIKRGRADLVGHRALA
ncbi:MAG: GGDEF domain-containing protein [Rhodospirillales bacterium]|nr:GGDEF domain-containing protein [Rhodospirillales bacterium]MDP6885111.1 GGDEF domain-containing protein [Rhodospirillales bacterium]